MFPLAADQTVAQMCPNGVWGVIEQGRGAATQETPKEPAPLVEVSPAAPFLKKIHHHLQSLTQMSSQAIPCFPDEHSVQVQ